MEMFGDDDMSDGESHTHLIKAPDKDTASPLNNDEDYLLEQALDEVDEYDQDSTTSFI